MKVCDLTTILTVFHFSTSTALVPRMIGIRRRAPLPMQSTTTTSTSSTTSTTQLCAANMESDFASAMPEAPKLTKLEFLQQAADRTLASVQDSLAEGVEGVPALQELKDLRANDKVSENDLAAAIYTLMIERGMTYDEDPDTGLLSPTDFDIPSNLETPEVKKEFLFLYRYGMQLISNGFVGVDTVKDIVQERLIARTGLTPEKFDEWLGF